MTDIAAHQLGATLVGRLKEAAYRLAFKIRITTQSGQILQGIDAVVFIGEDAMTDLAGIHHQAVPSGVQTVLNALQVAYGQVEQDLQGQALEGFFELYRGSLSVAECCTGFQIRFETAEQLAGLQLNNVGKTHLSLKHAGLSQKFIDGVYLKVDGDRNRFNEVYQIV